MGSWLRETHVTRRLPVYLEGTLAPDQKTRVERHLARCASCRQRLHALQSARIALADAAVVPAPETLWNGIETRLPAASVPESGKIPRPNPSFFIGKRHSRGGSNRVTLSLAGALLITCMAGDLMPGKRLWRESADARPPLSVSWKANSWQVNRLRGAPVVGRAIVANVARLQEGESLVTGAGDSARVQVADIGQVDVAPNSRLRLVRAQNNLHRLALDRGQLSAHVVAPPRLFLVDTPSAVAVDLGCAYTLRVDDAGNTRLQVKTGSVSLEGSGQAITVTAGSVCLTRKGKGTGTPFAANGRAVFQSALQRFDFENGGDSALKDILQSARSQDALTLFYLLPRMSLFQRERFISRLNAYYPFPKGVTRPGIRRLDPDMLAKWKAQIDFNGYSIMQW